MNTEISADSLLPPPSGGQAMNRAFTPSLIVLGLILVGVFFESRTFAWASSGMRLSRLSPDERAELLRYANDTWRSFERLTQSSGLPRDGVGWGNPSRLTTPADIAAYLWSVLAAERLKLIGPEECRSRLQRTLSTLASMERHSGFYLNDLDARTGATLKISPFDASPRRPLVSSLDNAWLATALVMVTNVEPTLRSQASKLLEAMNFRFFYDPYNSVDPINHPGQLHVGYWVDDRSFYGHYGMLNSEARIASYLGISRSQLPPEHYYRL